MGKQQRIKENDLYIYCDAIIEKEQKMNITETNSRIEWLDIAKGFSILFIVLGHTSDGFIQWFCFSFNSVIFFILSGMTFCRIKNKRDELLCFDNRTTKELVLQIGKKILLPYFVWGGISIMIYYLCEGIVLSRLQTGNNEHFAILPNVLGLLYGNSETGFFEYYRPLWFFPCLVIVELISFFILKIMYRMPKKKAWMLWAGFMLFFASFGVMESYFQWQLILPFEIESAIFMSFFFGIGLLLRSRGRKYYEKISQFFHNQKRVFLLFCVWVIIALIGIYMNKNTDARTDYFSNIWLFMFNSLWMAAGVIYSAYFIQKCAFMEYIGKRTLAILVLHKYPIMAFKLFPFIQVGIQDKNLLIEISVTTVTILMCLTAERIISKFLPQLFGNV